MKTYLSYCRFAIVSLKDYYRAMLFCINAKKEIEKEIEGKENVGKVVFVMLDKYEKFINDNIDIYNYLFDSVVSFTLLLLLFVLCV